MTDPIDPTRPQPVTYWDYVAVERLLELQKGLEPSEAGLSQDEVVFITVHQVYELWFKLVLRDLTAARDLFAKDRVPDDALAGVRRLLDRVPIILELSSQHWTLVETITSRDFLDFRDKLFPANGGQSPQFREIEILLGLEESERIPYVTGGSYLEILDEPDGSAGWAARRVRARLADRPTLREAVDGWLYRTPIDGSGPDQDGDAAVVARFIDGYLAAHARAVHELAARLASSLPTAAQRDGLTARYEGEVTSAARFLKAEDRPPAERDRRQRIRAAVLFIETYRELPLLAWPREIVDGLVAVEQAFVSYRQRHARMAERVIGRRIGTGGSSGVEYLDKSAGYRIFHDLWGVRTLLISRARVPDPAAPEFYRFRFEGP